MNPSGLLAGAIFAVLFTSGLLACDRESPASRKASPPQNSGASKVSLSNLSLPPPPDPGALTLDVSGAVQLRVKGTGITCEPDGGFSVSAADLEGLGANPTWSLVRVPKTLHFNFGPIETGARFQTALEEANTKVSRTQDGYQVQAKLDSVAGNSSVQVSATLKCPNDATSNRMPEEIVSLLTATAGTKVEHFSRIDFGRGRDFRSISIVVPERDAAGVLQKVRAQLPAGLVAYIGTTEFLSNEKPQGVEIVVGPGRDQFDIVRLARSDGANYDLGTEALVKTLQAIHKADPIDIFQAETDTVQFRLIHAPKAPRDLARKIYEFCPDTVDQGVGTLSALEQTIVRDRKVFLWWD